MCLEVKTLHIFELCWFVCVTFSMYVHSSLCRGQAHTVHTSYGCDGRCATSNWGFSKCVIIADHTVLTRNVYIIYESINTLGDSAALTYNSNKRVRLSDGDPLRSVDLISLDFI